MPLNELRRIRSRLGTRDRGHVSYTSRRSSQDLPKLAPEVGFEPTTNRLTADRSTTELLRIRQLKTSYPAKTEKQLPLSTGPLPPVVEPTIRRGGLTADRSTTELLRILPVGGQRSLGDT
jgi:hypothetical protein